MYVVLFMCLLNQFIWKRHSKEQVIGSYRNYSNADDGVVENVSDENVGMENAVYQIAAYRIFVDPVIHDAEVGVEALI